MYTDGLKSVELGMYFAGCEGGNLDVIKILNRNPEFVNTQQNGETGLIKALTAASKQSTDRLHDYKAVIEAHMGIEGIMRSTLSEALNKAKQIYTNKCAQDKTKEGMVRARWYSEISKMLQNSIDKRKLKG